MRTLSTSQLATPRLAVSSAVALTFATRVHLTLASSIGRWCVLGRRRLDRVPSAFRRVPLAIVSLTLLAAILNHLAPRARAGRREATLTINVPAAAGGDARVRSRMALRASERAVRRGHRDELTAEAAGVVPMVDRIAEHLGSTQQALLPIRKGPPTRGGQHSGEPRRSFESGRDRRQ